MGAELRTSFGPLTITYDAEGIPPRPWTRLQSQWGADLLATLPDGDVLELCAGAGQIGLLALIESDQAHGSACRSRPRRLVQLEQETTACRRAAQNARRAGLDGRVDVRAEPVEHALRPEERFVLVLADPPWVPTAQVGDHPADPPWAIDGGPDGLDVVRALLPVCERHVHQDGAVLLQLGGREQLDQVGRLLLARRSVLEVVDVRDAPDGNQGAVALLTVRGVQEHAEDPCPHRPVATSA